MPFGRAAMAKSTTVAEKKRSAAHPLVEMAIVAQLTDLSVLHARKV